ncbi:MAG: AI-2E family transporter [Acidobacteria bacterium]|nr:MAG: AI-2E family transporter [Acidobacteriota bacterium]
MLLFDARTARALATVLLYALALLFIYFAWHTLVTFLFAIMFAYLLEPAVSGLQHRARLSRGHAVLTIYILISVAIGLFFAVFGPQILRQAGRLSDSLPALMHRITSGELLQQIARLRHWNPQTEQRVQQFLASHQHEISGWILEMLSAFASVGRNIIWVLLVPVLAIFFLLSGGRFAQAILDQLDRLRQRSFVRDLLQDMHDVLANYIRIQIILAVLTLLVYVGGFVAFRIPYAVALGVATGLLDFIPIVGPLIGAVTVLAVAFFSGYPYVIFVALFIGAWRLFMDYYLSPRMFGHRVQLHPLAVLFGVLAGAEIAGIIGVYLSVPILAILRAAWTRWRTFQGERSIILPSSTPPPPPPIEPAS